MGQTHYDLLGVPKNATNSQITEAWRHRRVNEHPDKVRQQWRGRSESDIEGEIARRAKLLQDTSRARDVLLDPGARRQYDASIEVEFTRQPQPPQPAGNKHPTGGSQQRPPSSDDFVDLKIDADDLFGAPDLSRPGAAPSWDDSRSAAAPPDPLRSGKFGVPSYGQHRAAPLLVFAMKRLEPVGFQPPQGGTWPDLLSALQGLHEHIGNLFTQQKSRPGRAGNVVPPGHVGLFKQGKNAMLAMPGTYARSLLTKTTFVGLHSLDEPLSFGGIFAFAPSARRPLAVVVEGTQVRVTDKAFVTHAGLAPGGVFAMDVFDHHANDVQRVDNSPLVWTRPANFSGHRGIYAQIYKIDAGASALATDAHGHSTTLSSGVHVIAHPSVKVSVL